MGPHITIADLKGYIQSDTNIAPAFQALFHNGQVLSDEKRTLDQCQLKENDMLQLLITDGRGSVSGAGTTARSQGTAASLTGRSQSRRAASGEPDPEVTRLQGKPGPEKQKNSGS